MGPSVPEFWVWGLSCRVDSWIPRPARLGKVPRRGQSWGCGGVMCTWGGAGKGLGVLRGGGNVGSRVGKAETRLVVEAPRW